MREIKHKRRMRRMGKGTNKNNREVPLKLKKEEKGGVTLRMARQKVRTVRAGGRRVRRQ